MSHSEIADWLSSFGVQIDDINSTLRYLDPDNDGDMETDELASAMRRAEVTVCRIEIEEKAKAEVLEKVEHANKAVKKAIAMQVRAKQACKPPPPTIDANIPPLVLTLFLRCSRTPSRRRRLRSSPPSSTRLGTARSTSLSSRRRSGARAGPAPSGASWRRARSSSAGCRP